MNKLKTATLVVALCGVTAAQAVTIATHSDPSSGSPSVFTVDFNTNIVSGGWIQPGLNLSVPVVSGSNANLNMWVANMSITNIQNIGPLTLLTLGAGEIRYYDTNINNPVFQINFDSATLLEPSSAQAADLTGNNVVFSGSALGSLSGTLTNEVVNYSFANPIFNGNVHTYTASMTSSADVVPEPVTLGMLLIGATGIASRRRARR